MSAIDEAIDELTRLRQGDARRHSDEIFDLMKEKATADLQCKEQARKIDGLDAAVKLLVREGAENAKIAQLFRDHLDDNASEQENDNEWEQEARQITWNEEDAKASRHANNTDFDVHPWPKAIKEM